MKRSKTLVPLLAFLAALSAVATGSAPAAPPETPPPPAAAPEPRLEPGAATAIALFAKVEDAWASSDTDRLTTLVDTTDVRIALKPGAPLTAAITRSAAAFLLQDQLRLVRTASFQMIRMDYDVKRRTSRATAMWRGDWGGRLGKRSVRVTLFGRQRGDRWFVREIRAED